jgi:hypothetical protein
LKWIFCTERGNPELQTQDSVRKISGHAPGSKEFYKYVAVAQTYQDRETEKMYIKMKQMHVIATSSPAINGVGALHSLAT